MRSARSWFWPVVLLQVLLLLGMVGRHVYTLQTGAPVTLKTAPIDPWDFLRGEYVRLNYEISALNPEGAPMQGIPYRPNQRVWVTLAQGNPYWSAVGVSDRRPETGPGQVAVIATVDWYNDFNETAPAGERPIPRLRLRYGIEQFYVPEGEGVKLEQRSGEMVVEALVDRFGRLALRSVFLDGKELDWH